jgi:nucleotide-binding universal stress UspA family protein
MGTQARMVVALDDSEAARRAAAFATNLAAREKAELTFCGVVYPLETYVSTARRAATGIDGLVAELENDARKLCLTEVARAQARSVYADAAIVQGEPAAAIAQEAGRRGATAIVVGTHGRRGLRLAVLGSVARDLVRGSGPPVFVVRGEAVVDADGPILVAVDDSARSAATIRAAVAFARSERAALHLFHVFGTSDIDRVPAHIGYDPDVEERRAYALAVDELDDLTEIIRNEEDVPFGTEICEGDPLTQTIAVATRIRARFIVTGTHRRSVFGHLVSPSFTERLMTNAPVPVLAIRT